MKTWLGVMGIAVLLTGCQNSTTKVASVVPRPAPDAVVSDDDMTVEVFGPDHSETTMCGTDAGEGPQLSEAVDRLVGYGYLIDPSRTLVAHAATVDGRSADVIWRFAAGIDGAEGGIFEVVTGDGRTVLSYGVVGDRVEPIPARTHSELRKRDGGPEGVGALYGCLGLAITLFYACMNSCFADGGSPPACAAICAASAVMTFLRCLFTMA